MIKFIVVVIGILFSNIIKADQNSPKLDLLFEELFLEEDMSKQNFIVNKIWDEWMLSNNTDVQIIMNNISNYFQSKNYKEAVSALSLVIELEPNFSEAYNKRATFYFMMGDYENSMKDIKSTLILEPRHFGALDGMSRILIFFSKYEEALKVYDQMKLLMPNDITLDLKIDRINKLIYDDA